jgi:hypothetical protein
MIIDNISKIFNIAIVIEELYKVWKSSALILRVFQMRGIICIVDRVIFD